MSDQTIADTPAPVVPDSTVPAAPTPEQAAPPQGADQATPEATQEGDTREDQKQERPRQKASERIGELYGRMKSAERERDAAIAEVQRLREPPVSREQFEQLPYDEQQREIVRQTIREERAAEIEQAALHRHVEAEQLRAQQYQDRLATAREAIPDIDEKLSDPTLPITDHAARIIAESERGPQLAYWLASNRAEAERISRLAPSQQSFELGKIAARINAAPQARKISKAPAPVPTVGGGSGSSPKGPADMSTSDMAAYLREKGLIR